MLAAYVTFKLLVGAAYISQEMQRPEPEITPVRITKERVYIIKTKEKKLWQVPS